jgi:hypothetical protein
MIVPTLVLILILFIAVSVGGRVVAGVLNAMGIDRGDRRVPPALDVETDARLARMEEAIQVMATEIERLRAAREEERRYLSAGADEPRRAMPPEDDSRPA